jgi:tetratricopeptide (TPR) repeat protein
MLKNLFYTLFIIFFFSFHSFGQIPDKFTNLQVLPKDISKNNLVDVMKSFTGALGVRCIHCHQGEEGQPFTTYDFASDLKTAKQKARIMMNMTADINEKYLSALTEFKDKVLEVKCITCHRGAAQPIPLEDLLFKVVKQEGLEKAISTYHDLYENNYGGFAYDFKDHTLAALGKMLTDESMYDEALAFANINTEKYPESGVAYLGLAQAYELKGDKINAVKYYKKTLELMPRGADFINKKLEELQKN